MSALDQLYQQVILDHSKERHGCGPYDHHPTTSHQVNPTCGDEVTLGVTMDADGSVREVSWDGDGCSISQSSLSILHDLVQGQDVETVSKLYAAMETMMHSRGRGVDDSVLDLLEDAAALEGTSKFPNRVKCALLGWYALRDALALQGINISGGNND